eukprot:jgi/Astpho2/5989/Aster-x1339
MSSGIQEKLEKAGILRDVVPKVLADVELTVVNIPGPAVKKGEALAPYKGKQMQPVLRAIDSTQDQTTEMSTVAAGPAPPKGKHRYVILLWKQLGEAHKLAEAPSACVCFYSQPS